MAKKSTKETRNEWLELFPLISIVLLIPIIVFVKLIELDGYLYEIWTGDKVSLDFFSVWKSRVLYSSCVLATGILIYLKYKKSLVKINALIFSVPLLIYGIFVFISTIFLNTRKLPILV